jgi:hypothetical protein
MAYAHPFRDQEPRPSRQTESGDSITPGGEAMTNDVAIRPTASTVAEALISESSRAWTGSTLQRPSFLSEQAVRAVTPTYVLDVDVALAVCGDWDFPGVEESEPGLLSWDRMLEIGAASADAGRRSDARRAYLIAFDRAAETGSVRGILLVAAALGALGGEDRAVESMVRATRRLFPTVAAK